MTLNGYHATPGSLNGEVDHDVDSIEVLVFVERMLHVCDKETQLHLSCCAFRLGGLTLSQNHTSAVMGGKLIRLEQRV